MTTLPQRLESDLIGGDEFAPGLEGAIAEAQNGLRYEQRQKLQEFSHSVLEDMLARLEWRGYSGEYTKQFQDIKLWSGEVYENCWPNANTFHEGVTGRVINRKDVAYIRINPKAALTAYCIGEGGKS